MLWGSAYLPMGTCSCSCSKQQEVAGAGVTVSVGSAGAQHVVSVPWADGKHGNEPLASVGHHSCTVVVVLFV